MTPPATAADARVEYRSGVPHLVWSAVDGAARYEVLQYDPKTGGWLDALPGTAGTTTQTDVVPRQLVAVADSYDAIATVRPYHKPRSHDDVMRILFDARDRKYDAYVLTAFVDVIAHSDYRAAR